MEKFTIKQIAKAKVNPVFKGLSDELKDPKNYKRIEKKLFNVMVSDHKHKAIAAFMKCSRCQEKFANKRALIKELGFESTNQYQNWKKIMGIIISKRDLVLYEKG